VTLTTWLTILGITDDDRASLIIAINGPGLVLEFGELGVLIAVTVVAMRAGRREPHSMEWYEL
jgi:hypothetical protein